MKKKEEEDTSSRLKFDGITNIEPSEHKLEIKLLH
jgi:hypothetical protein